jgi:probable rRNA maturation factor
MEITVLFHRGTKPGSPPEEWLKEAIRKTLVAEGADPSSEVSLVITDQECIHQLNREYLGEDRPTDVLAFLMLPSGGETRGFVSPPDGLAHLGEVIISLPQATAQAEEHGHSMGREIAILTVHGVLHLLGYDHDGPDAERSMKAREREILTQIHDPQER